MMSRKDYQRAAELILEKRDSLPNYPSKSFYGTLLVEVFATFFKADNPRFDEVKFREACYRKDKTHAKVSR